MLASQGSWTRGQRLLASQGSRARRKTMVGGHCMDRGQNERGEWKRFIIEY
jgi:hypothetical protein